MKIEPRKTTKEDRCTIRDVFYCFLTEANHDTESYLFTPREIAYVHQSLGVNKPRFMVKEGFLTKSFYKQAEFYGLTQSGEKDLVEKYLKYRKHRQQNKHLYTANT